MLTSSREVHLEVLEVKSCRSNGRVEVSEARLEKLEEDGGGYEAAGKRTLRCWRR